MKFGKYLFKSFEEFQSIQNLAFANGIRTMKEFTEFLRLHCSHLLVN
ncbi:hypothetical protein AAX25_01682 [Aliarcobacter thereius]|nr:hypothetical protein AAX25_01682 [Aliarcobacter thereius]